MSVVDDIRQRIDIIDLVGSYVPLEKAGRNYRALCPFHTEKTPSFIVFPETQRWHCFGACSTGGDVFNFVMRRENVEFGEALRMLAERAGVELEPLSTGAREAQAQRERLYQANAAAARYYHRRLLDSPDAEPARRYLELRGLLRETIDTFQIGWAPEEWHALEEHLRSDYGVEDQLEAGLLTRNERGNRYDRFRGRVLFPIRDDRGRVIAFGGRVLDDSLPKYLNTSDSPLFDKSSALYGLDLAREQIRETGTAVVVEGYMDVVVPYQCGVRNLVACMGTALTEAHIRALRRMTRVLILALDPDAAGLRATERGVETAMESLDRKTVPVITPRGLIRYESRLATEIRVMPLPDGLDPDELVLQDRARWDRLVAQALPVAEHLLAQVLAEEDLSTARGKRNAVERLMPVIAAIDNPAERDHYLQLLAQRVRVDEQHLLPELNRLRGGRGSGRQTRATPMVARDDPTPEEGPAAPGALTAPDLEGRVIALLYELPALLPDVQATVALSGDAFADALNRQAFETLVAAQEASGAEADLLGLLDTSLQSHVESLLHAIRVGPTLSLDIAREDLIKCAARLRKAHLARSLNELRFVQQDARELGDEDTTRELNVLIDRLTKVYLQVDRQSYAATLVGRSRKESRHS